MGDATRDIVTGVAGVRARALEDAPFGVEVEVDCTAPLDAATGTALRRLLATHDLLVVRGGLTTDEQLRLCGALGRVLPQGPRVEVNVDPPQPQPEVLWLSNAGDGALGNDELAWHLEFAYLPTPCAGLSLYAEQVATGQAGTRFASGRLAHAALPAALATRVEQLQGLFVAQFDAHRRATLQRHRDLAVDPAFPRAVHPLVARHPVTGARSLFVSHSQTDRVLGLDDPTSEALLEELWSYCYAPAVVHEHRYAPGDCVVWDNLNAQHARGACTPTLPRRLRRVLFGPRAPWEEWPAVPPAGP
jgi:taurine dioxygenase